VVAIVLVEPTDVKRGAQDFTKVCISKYEKTWCYNSVNCCENFVSYIMFVASGREFQYG
jgi:hypothetical protein